MFKNVSGVHEVGPNSSQAQISLHILNIYLGPAQSVESIQIITSDSDLNIRTAAQLQVLG